MGIFSFNYNKPGPGVDKDAPQKKGIFRYFEIFFRKFWKLLQVNMLYFICSIPMIVLVFGLVPLNDAKIVDFFVGDSTELVEVSAMLPIMLRCFLTILILVFAGSGPASAGYAYITRCFTREQHAWILSDFKDKFKENFKQSIVVSIVDLVVLVFGCFSVSFYFSQYKTSGSEIWLILCCLLCTLLVLFTFMHIYIYQFMVTFEYKISQLYRNAFIFSFAQLPINIFLAIIAIGINFIMFNFLHPFFAVFVDLFIGYSLMRFPMDYTAARAIEKKLLPHAAVIEYEEESYFGSDSNDTSNEGEE